MNVQIVCVFSFWQIESTLCLFIDLFTYYDLVKYTLIPVKWSLPWIWLQWSSNTSLHFSKMRVKETSGSTSMNLAAVLPADTQEIWLLSLCLPETLESGHWSSLVIILCWKWVTVGVMIRSASWLFKYRLCTDTITCCRDAPCGCDLFRGYCSPCVVGMIS